MSPVIAPSRKDHACPAFLRITAGRQPTVDYANNRGRKKKNKTKDIRPTTQSPEDMACCVEILHRWRMKEGD